MTSPPDCARDKIAPQIMWWRAYLPADEWDMRQRVRSFVFHLSTSDKSWAYQTRKLTIIYRSNVDHLLYKTFNCQKW